MANKDIILISYYLEKVIFCCPSRKNCGYPNSITVALNVKVVWQWGEEELDPHWLSNAECLYLHPYTQQQ